MLHRMTWKVVLVMTVALLVAGPHSWADRVSELENKVIQLEQQNQELQGMLQDLLTEVRQQKVEVEEVKQIQVETTNKAPQAALEGLGDKIKIGGDWRLRGVMWDNIWDMNDDVSDSREFYRMRTRLFLDMQLMDNLKFFFRAANEYRWGDDAKANTLLGPDLSLGFKEMFLDNAYIEWSEPMDIENLTLKMGRQDLIYGEGFLILDGQDNVGSSAIGFDGLKASYAFTDTANLDLFMMKVEEKNQTFADDEDLYGAYLTIKEVLENHKVEAYVLHRNQNSADDYFTAIGGPAGVYVDPAQHTTALGARVSGSFMDKDLTYAVEGTYQFGELQNVSGFYFPGATPGDDIDRKAWGGYLWGKYTWNDSDWKPSIKLQGVYTTGNDPDSSDFEGFDTFYGEWPKYSEGYIYQLYDPFDPLKGGIDGDLGAWSNIIIAGAELGVKPTEEAGITLSYQHMWADEETGLGSGDTRGDMVIGILTYDFNKYLSGHLLGEYFWPDDYYPDDADEAFFARYQMFLKF